jgi:hypothetical protein
MELKEHCKPVFENKEILTDIFDEDLSQKAIHRIYAVKKTFNKVSFKQSDISYAYFRNCKFINCDFTGATITASNMRGSSFDGCNFKYTTWEHTILDADFLDKCLPSEENLARDLVRNLRVNFAQIGNYEAVNKSASIEVKLTGEHLFQAAYSKQSHYRLKHKGWDRVFHGIRHAQWKALDILWGNGESIFRIIISGTVFIFLSAILLTIFDAEFPFPVAIRSVAIGFWGIKTSPLPPDSYLVFLTIIRFTLFGLFMAVLVKRFSRR